MEVSMFSGFNDMGMMNDLSFIHQLQVNTFDDIFGPTTLPAYVNGFDQLGTSNHQAMGCKRSAQSDLHTLMDKPIKQLKKNNDWNTYEIKNNVFNSSLHQEESNNNNNNSTMLSFSNNSSNCSNQSNSGLITPKEEVAVSNVSFPSHGSPFDKQSCIFEASPQATKKSSNFVSMPQHSKDHILAERKRREKLSQRFIALSAIIPGLKKMDKASVLGDAIKYVKQMQERVTKLEEEAKKKTVESAVYVKRSYVSVEEDDRFSGQTTTFSGVACEGSFPEIEARFSDKDVLLKIHCENKKGLLEKVISKVEQLNLVVVSNSSLAFGGSALAVTIIAQVMDAEFSLTAKDLVKHIHATLKCLT